MYVMKVIAFLGCVLLTLARYVNARPLESDVQILRYENDVQADGYNFSYETSDGTKQDATGSLDGNGALSVRGSFSYVGDDGVTYTVNYTADENGFQPEGDHIPIVSNQDIERSKVLTLGLPPSAVISLVGG